MTPQYKESGIRFPAFPTGNAKALGNGSAARRDMVVITMVRFF
jgi:hypothetical protein